MINVLFAAGPENWADYQAPLRACFAREDLNVALSTSHAAAETDYIIYAPSGPLQDFSPYRNCKAVLSLWAGVERIVGNQSLTMPLCRMVDPGLTQGMVEWVSGHCLRYHLNIDGTLSRQSGAWDRYVPPLASERRVTVLGLGQLGQACATALARIGFDVTGWARSAKAIAGVRCLHGVDGLSDALRTAEILVLLLPDTPDTDTLINAQRLAQLPQGARILNPGRGTLIDDAALLAALDRDHIAHATLDVFRQEPLPPDHLYWAHPNVTVTPHIAAETRPETAARVIAENIRRSESGEPLLYLVDRALGY
ncbi:glyoxylate/hydroxypyruvate reductase A [Cognatishimia sp. SS12]|uniref:2-hydroxyacid dehydrogenase n=1 Tax=Cognatishimia sp. SS12 TaxID=2979465 RepID=UPI0023313BA1|nr:glyoxylate/hydroxypyruvate reductase A [Cognatishimia sp. SS12]MDC0738995.1 glyoxylate/hydroxypyruvate reductase A [Cognatishimia sp. SS12]